MTMQSTARPVSDSAGVGLDESAPAPRWWQAPRGRRWALQVVVVAALLAVWQLISGHLVDPLYVSSPWAVARRMVTLFTDGILWPNARATFSQAFAGFLIGAVAGIVIGNVMGILKVVGQVACRGITLRRILLQASETDRFQVPRDEVVQAARRPRVFV